MKTPRLIVAALVMTAVAPATAHASTAVATPVIFGAGRVSTTLDDGPYRCTSTVLTNNTSFSCPEARLEKPEGDTATMTLVAAARSTGGWKFSNWNDCPEPHGSTCVVEAIGTQGPPRQDTIVFANPIARFVDATPPVVTNLKHTFTPANSQVRFTWDVDDSATFRCRIDNGAFSACSDGETFTLPEGNQTLTVRATDPAGNVADNVTDTVRVIDTRLVSGPQPFQRARTASFRIASAAGVAFECGLITPSLPSPGLRDCGAKGADGTLTVPFSAAALAQDGEYTFVARARDGGDFDQTPLRRTWTIDTVAPQTTLSSPDITEAGVTTLLTAAFSYASSEPGTLQCSVDGAPFSACTSPRTLTDVAFGPHSFQVRAVDGAGNADPTPAVRHWTVTQKDADGDGFDQRRDCDDANPRVHPGARDIPANRRDEDCNGRDAARKRVTGDVAHSWSVLGSSFTLTRLAATGLAKGTKLQVRCTGSDCPFTRTPVKARPRHGKVNLLKALPARHFRAGQTLEVRLTARNRNGTVLRFKLAAGRLPAGRALCLPPGAKKPKRRC